MSNVLESPTTEAEEQENVPSYGVAENATVEEAGHDVNANESAIPGEGSCLVDGQTYENNSSIPPIGHCHVSCKCASSILVCESVTCIPAPSNLENCMPIYPTPDSCCPTYSCSEYTRKFVPYISRYTICFVCSAHGFFHHRIGQSQT